jgi:hypothetical protein
LERDFKVTFQDWETRGKRVCARLEFKGIEKTKSDPNPNQGEATLTSIQGALSGVVWFDPDLGLTIETAAKGDLTSVKNTSPQATTSEMKQVVSAKLTLVE